MERYISNAGRQIVLQRQREKVRNQLYRTVVRDVTFELGIVWKGVDKGGELSNEGIVECPIASGVAYIQSIGAGY